MPVTLDNPSVIRSDGPQRARFTRDQYHFLLENGLLSEDHRYELIDGAVFEKMGQKQPHIGLIGRWLIALGNAFGYAYIHSQLPIVLSDDTEPEPDFAILARPGNDYLAAGTTPAAADARLIVEISVSSLVFDTAVKADRYARAGIPEYWASDVEGRRLIVHRDPTPDGYANVVSLSEGESISPLSAPHTVFVVADFLP